MMACGRATHDGGCFCGAVRYRIEGAIGAVTNCHCQSCRRSAGAVFVTWFTVERSRFAWTNGAPAQYGSSPGVTRQFCGQCGTELTYANDQDADSIDITLASLDCAAGHPADRHIWTADKLDWLELDGRLPRHEGWATET